MEIKAPEQAKKNQHQNSQNIRFAFFLNIAFTIVEIFGGLWTNSLAILSDALHDLGDSFSLGLSWYFEKIARKKSDEVFSYGYRRFSLLAALINTIVLIIGSILIISEAIPRIFNPEHSNSQGMLLFAIAGIVINGAAILRLKGGKSQNIKIVALHFLEDVLGWVAVLIVSFVLLFKDIHVLDPLLSILITGYVLFNVLKNLKTTLKLFLQAVPENILIQDIENHIRSLAYVCSIHHTHIWSLDGENHVLSTHVVVDQETPSEYVRKIKNEIRKLCADLAVVHTTIEIEFENDSCQPDS